jgi:type VI secretion system secreted protein Hcp
MPNKPSCLHPQLLIFLFCLSSGVSAYAQADQPVIAYASIQGTKQGNFKGGTMMKGKEGQIECVGFSYNIQSPRDAATGMASGKRQHSPVVIVKHIDGASPQLIEAAYNNEVLKTVTIEFYRVAPDGKQAIFQTFRLTNVTISKVSQFGGTSCPEKLVPNSIPYEEVSFVFQKIEIDNNEAKTSAVDNWTVN